MTGAHLRSEVHDRPLAYRLAEAVNLGLTAAEADERLRAVVMSDLWWLNNEALRSRPTISIGAPDVNALSAYLADKLPFVFSVEGTLGVQMDLDFVDPWVACWGVSPEATTEAVRVFQEKYAEHFVKEAAKYTR